MAASTLVGRESPCSRRKGRCPSPLCVQRGPAVKYKDLEQMVTTRLSYSELPVRVRLDTMRYSQDHSLIPVTVFLKDRDLHFASEKDVQGRLVARVSIFAVALA